MATFPTSAGHQVIRTGVLPADIDSEAGGLSDEEEAPEEGDAVPNGERLILNKEKFAEECKSWTLKSIGDTIFIQSPGASKLGYGLMHPGVYRNIQPIDMKGLAELLGTPENWEEVAEEVKEHVDIVSAMASLNRLTATESEGSIQLRYSAIIQAVARLIGLQFFDPISERTVGVGGFLAEPEYDFRSRTDLSFDIKSKTALATEVKTVISFAPGHPWYGKSRTAQVLCALYSYNCPTLLLTQSYWKLFVENKKRNCVYTFPTDSELAPNLQNVGCEPVGSAFITALVIILLPHVKEAEVIGKGKTPERVMLKTDLVTPSKESKTPGTGIRQSSRIAALKSRRLPASQESSSAPRDETAPLAYEVQPTFIAGHDKAGAAIYLPVRIIPAEFLRSIENEEEEAASVKQNAEVNLAEEIQEQKGDEAKGLVPAENIDPNIQRKRKAT
jgi:hypothetical protein